ncbi:MAG TPA: hypothetical protein VMU14_15420, partial [Acidimicrobiales bacterium]|nr:hypothetical protein [Acidimicrobiales bacterium]
MSAEAEQRERWSFAGALGISTLVALVDLLITPGVVLISLLILGPLFAACTVRARLTLVVALYSLAWAVVLGVHDHIIGTADHFVRLSVVASAGAISVYAAWQRERAQDALEKVTRVAEVAQAAILRPPSPRLGDMAFAARYVSASAAASVGGDLYESSVARGG